LVNSRERLDMLGLIPSLVGLAMGAVLLAAAWTKWITASRADLPSWRNAIGGVALFLLSANLCGAVLLLGLGSRGSSVPSIAYLLEIELSRPLALVAILFAVALKGGSRVQAALAGLSMFLFLPLGYV
jgi:hypothetical protein